MFITKRIHTKWCTKDSLVTGTAKQGFLPVETFCSVKLTEFMKKEYHINTNINIYFILTRHKLDNFSKSDSITAGYINTAFYI